MTLKRDHIALKQLQVEQVAPSALRANDYNPNRQTDDEFQMLLASMREDGFTTPIIATQDGIIVDGEHRWRAAQELGYETVPVVRVSMTEAQRRIATMRHNRARGQDDTGAVADLMLDLEKLGALDWAQEALLLSDEEMRRLTAMADTVAEDLSRGHEFSQAWEPVERTEYQPPDQPGVSVSYSRPVAATEKPDVAMDKGTSSAETGGKPATPPEPMTRRQFVITVSEAAVVDRVLGEQAATRLVQLCQEAEKNGW